jgi:hypothetical protein
MNLSRLALVGCVLALCTASAQAQQPTLANNGNAPGGNNAPAGDYADPGYANGQVDGGYADSGYADGSYGDCDCDECQGRGCGYLANLFSQRRGLFYFTAEAIAWRRNSQAVRQVAVIDDLGAPLFNTGSLNFHVMLGQRYTLGFMTDEQTAIEATYFSIDNWNYSRLINPAPGAGIVTLPGALPLNSVDYLGADNMQLNYSARLLNGELNVIRPLAWPDIGFLAGFRYLQLNENFNIHALNTIVSQASDYNTRTTNNLYGGQIGTRIRKQWDLFGIEFTGKAGLFDNDSRQKNYVDDQNNSVALRPLRGGNTHSASFVGDINLTGTFRIDTNWVLRFGYNVLWVERVALAPDQLDFRDPTIAASGTGINHRGGLFAHGVNAGLEARF